MIARSELITRGTGLRIANDTQATPDQPSVAADTYERLVRARRFIDECYYLPLDLEQISGEACLSRYHFLRLFRRAFNKTPHQYLTQRRIEKAKELLSSSGLTVTDATCPICNFQSVLLTDSFPFQTGPKATRGQA